MSAVEEGHGDAGTHEERGDGEYEPGHDAHIPHEEDEGNDAEHESDHERETDLGDAAAAVHDPLDDGHVGAVVLPNLTPLESGDAVLVVLEGVVDVRGPSSEVSGEAGEPGGSLGVVVTRGSGGRVALTGARSRLWLWSRVVVNDDRFLCLFLCRGTDLLLGDDDVVDVAAGSGHGRGLVDCLAGSWDVAGLDEACYDGPDVLLDSRADRVERVSGHFDGGVGARGRVRGGHNVLLGCAGPSGPIS